MKKTGIVVFLILLIALFLRTYRTSDLLGFYYDQGRDAKIIWDLWHQQKFFLIGPTTGIEGIFLGPFFYYLIAPFYILGNGNPVVPALALAFLNVVGIYVIYQIAKEHFDHLSGILAMVFIGFSFYLIGAHRWLSNPTPLPFFAAIAVWALLKITQGQSKYFWLTGLTIGLSLQLEAASAVFFIPATMVILFVNRQKIHWRRRSFILGLVLFGFTLLPQIYFNFRHQNLLVNSFTRFLVSEKSFRPKLSDYLPQRLQFYFSAFTNKFVYDSDFAFIFALIVFCLFIIFLPQILKKQSLKTLLIWCLTPVLFLVFYNGNNGYVWDYYFTGIYSFVALIIAVLFSWSWQKNRFGKILVSCVLILFFGKNLPATTYFLSTDLKKETSITLGTSLASVDWVIKDAGSRAYNVDVYVPPVISHAYDYLFIYRGSQSQNGHQPSNDRQPLLYTIYEFDPPHPERLNAWLDRQVGIGIVEESVRFGGVTAQRRLRIINQ